MATYKVKNLNGTSDNTVPSGYKSWLDFWSKKSGEPISICQKQFCFEKATDGAHVQIDNGGNEWYIVPLCHQHNLSKEVEFYVDGPLVPVNSLYPIRP